MMRLFSRILERCENARHDSDASYFQALMLLGEVIAKSSVLGMAAALNDDIPRSRYGVLYRVARADGIGEYAQLITEIAQGPTSQSLDKSANLERDSLIERAGPGSWQWDSVEHIAAACKIVIPDVEPPKNKTSFLRWFELFAQLRNRTRGHGATAAGSLAPLCTRLRRSMEAALNFPLYQREWAYLHQNLSGRYRVTPISAKVETFRPLAQRGGDALPDGVYIYFDRPRLVDLIVSDVEALDIYLPNGAFGARTFELLSYESDDLRKEESTRFLLPATTLPPSHTEGRGELVAAGKVMHNMPELQSGYVERRELEQELFDVLRDERHPVVTLAGRGGIGKTSLALRVLQVLAQEERYLVLAWLSARDIDLLPEGPKVVQPAVVDHMDIAREFWRLTKGLEKAKAEEQRNHLEAALGGLLFGAPTLFVVDNFETVRNPRELFTYLSTHVRLPNKVLITTRIRDFKADYPIEVTGMTDDETDLLIDSVARRLGIVDRVTVKTREQIKGEAQGHPYIVKVLLGELSHSGRPTAIKRVIGGKENILEALFERTYAVLSSAARRVFLSLCGWKSEVPEPVLEAVIATRSEEMVDVGRAIDELEGYSLIERVQSQAEKSRFVRVPLAARLFGQRKLDVSPQKLVVDADIATLQLFGVVNPSEVKHGLRPKLRSFFHVVAQKTNKDPEWLDAAMLTMLEVIAQTYPEVWLFLAEVAEQHFGDVGRACTYVERYIQTDPEDCHAVSRAWAELARLYKKGGNISARLNALVERAGLPCTSLWECSSLATDVNSHLAHDTKGVLEVNEMRLMVERMISNFETKLKGEVPSATDLSRLAWLCLKVRDEERAFELVTWGSRLEPDNEHMRKLREASFYQRLSRHS